MLMVVMGKRGSGKSTYLRNRLSEIPSFILYDSLTEHVDIGYEALDDPDDLLEYFGDYPDRPTAGYRAIYRGHPEHIGWDPEEDLEFTCELAYALGNLTLIIEEIDWYCRTQKIPEKVREAISYGRHRNLDMIVTARRAADFSRLISSQASDFVVFGMIEPRDVDWVCQATGEPGMAAIRDLPVGHYLHWCEGKVEEGETKP